MRGPNLLMTWLAFLIAGAAAWAEDLPDAVERPNVVLVYADDLGYGDLGCYGNPAQPTPNLDRMAREGIRFTDFYTAQAVCSASRAALMTGCYPNRVGILGALAPNAKHGIADGETTLGEVFKSRGYATAVFGKWHLGHHPQFLPTRHGFDVYLGLPYSNDMWPNHPTNRTFPPLPLIEQDQVIQIDPDQRMLTTQYTERAVAFIEQNRDRPFFVYLPHSMPHVPLHVSPGAEGKTGKGLYADVLAEIDNSVGQILATLDRLGLANRTLVMFASDNGPWLSYGDHAGSSGPLREGKGTTFEGGMRVPFIARWSGQIPPGMVCREPAMTIDILPTLARWIGADLSADRPIDGKDIRPLLKGEPGAKSPHDALLFYWDEDLQAVRSGRWKLHFPHAYRAIVHPAGSGGQPGKYEIRRIGLALFDLESDIGETTDVAAEHPEVVRRLEALADAARADLGDKARGIAGKGKRSPGRVE